MCGPCQLGNQPRVHHKPIIEILINKPLELFHIDLMGPFRSEILVGKRYVTYSPPLGVIWVELYNFQVQAPKGTTNSFCRKEDLNARKLGQSSNAHVAWHHMAVFIGEMTYMLSHVHIARHDMGHGPRFWPNEIWYILFS